MENSEPFEQSKPSQKIKEIEQTLLLLKSRIENMQKEQTRNVANIDRIVSSSIPILKNKFNQTHKTLQDQKKNRLMNIDKQRFHNITQSKIEHEKELQKSRQALLKAKYTETQSIKEISKKNAAIIALAKRKHREENRKKHELVREKKNQSKQKVSEFYLFKKYDLKKRKMNENEQLKSKIKKFNNSVSSLSKAEKNINEKVHETRMMLKKIRYAVEKLTKMKQDKFKDLTTYLGIENANSINQSTLERILNEINLNPSEQIDKSHSLHHINQLSS